MSNHITMIREATLKRAVDLVDGFGQRVPSEQLTGASAVFHLKVQPTDVSDVLAYSTIYNPTSLQLDTISSIINLTIQPAEVAALAYGLYFWQLQLTLATGDVLDVVPWDLFDLVVGGAASETPPAFDNTVKITADYPLPNDMTYVTPGGSPIVDAQVRVFKKSDYDAGVLSNPVGITTTDAYGRWRDPILVTTGFTYVAYILKPYAYGPDIRELFA